MPPRREPAPSLPEALKGEAPLVKTLYLWLLPQGEVSYSYRAIAEALGVYHHQVSNAMKRLRLIGLVEDLSGRRERARSRFKVRLEVK